MKIFFLIFLTSMQAFSNEGPAKKVKQIVECKDASQNQLNKLNSIYRTNLIANLNLKNRQQLVNELRPLLEKQKDVANFTNAALFTSEALSFAAGIGLAFKAATLPYMVFESVREGIVLNLKGIALSTGGLLTALGTTGLSLDARFDVDNDYNIALGNFKEGHEVIYKQKNLINENIEKKSFLMKLFKKGEIDYLYIKNMFDSTTASAQLYAAEASLSFQAYELSSILLDCQ